MDDLNGIIAVLRKFSKDRDWGQFHNPKNLAMALSVEVSEVLEELQWMTGEESKHLSPEKGQKVKEEIADVMIYLLMLSDKYDIDLIEAVKEKIEINEKKYPVEKAKGSSKKYNEL